MATIYGVPSSITRIGKTEPFGLQVARGQIPFHQPVTITGFNANVSTSWVTVSPFGAFTPLTTATTLEISSSSASDTGTGTGAQTVLLTGVNGSGVVVSETITLNGQTAVSTVNSYTGVNGFMVSTVGSGGTAAGSIYAGTGTVTSGVPAVIVDEIPIGWNTRQSGTYTVPAGYTAYVSYARVTLASSSSSNNAWARLNMQTASGISYPVAAAVVTVSGSVVQLTPEYPLPIAAGSTIYAQAEGVQTGTYEVTTLIQLVLVANSTDAGYQ
jgi:hypothetical protein